MIEAEHRQIKANRHLEGTSRTFKGLEGIHALQANMRQRLTTGIEVENEQSYSAS